MVAYLSASPGSWKLIVRTLGAVFAGSAVTMSATVLHGGSLLLGGVEPAVTTKPPANTVVAPSQQLPGASLPVPDQAAPWTPGVAPQWPSPPPYPFPMPPPPVAPVFENPWNSVPFSAPSAPPASPEQPAAAPAPPPSPADVASHGSAGSPPQTAHPPGGGSVGGVLGDVFHATDGTPR
jgi:hypothetical protein